MPPANTEQALPPVSIIAPRWWGAVDLGELWRYRGLLMIFVWREIKVRYKQTLLGFFWVALQPLAMTVVYTVLFGKLAHIPSDGVPYAVFVLSGIVLWQFFNRAVMAASTSLVEQQALISKIYFPRLIAPLSSVISALVDFAILFFWLLAIMAAFGRFPGVTVLLAPLFAFAAALLALGVSLCLTALDAHYRDVRYLLGFALQILYFATPIIYPAAFVPVRWRALLLLNPLAPIMLGFRWAMLGDVPAPELWSLLAALGSTLVCLVLGVLLFHRVERTIADTI